MCEYVRFNDTKLPICTFNNEICTLCVLGNAKRYKEIKDDKEKNNSEK